MSSKSLVLEKLFLTLASEKLNLEIASTVDIKFPSGLSHSGDDDGVVKALTSGNIWVSRGRRCRLDLEISFNGKPLDRTSRITILESFGYDLQVAHLWSQLSLSTSLEILQSDQGADSSRDISVYINHAMSSPKTQLKVWLLDNIDIKCPDSALCAEFVRLHVQLSFHQIQNRSRGTSKRVKSCTPKLDSPESMLLDYVSGQQDDKASSQKTDSVPSNMPAPDIALAKMKREQFPKETIEKLRAWLEAHPGNTSPTNAERLDLMKQTGLRSGQLSNWFSNVLRLKKFPEEAKTNDNIVSQVHTDLSFGFTDEDYEEEMLLSHFGDEILFDEQYDYLEEDEMLLSQTISTTPSHTSQSSTVSKISSTSSLKRPAAEEVIEANPTLSLTCLPLPPANKLASFALKTIIAGPSSRQRGFQGIQIRKPHLSTNLSVLVPSMFCPGFKELMAQNLKFLPTISTAICSSWVRNVQGAGLRRKLAALSNAKVSEYNDGDGKEDSAERLLSVVQGRLWKMMQTGLYDEGAVKKLWRKDGGDDTGNSNSNEEGCEDEDLLGENGGYENIDREGNLENYIEEELMDDEKEPVFEDLLRDYEDRDSDDGLLEYLEEQQRLAVEAETDEMVFGSGSEGGRCDEVEEEELLLLGDGRQEENMLL